MANSSEDITLNEKNKKKFVNKMMKLAKRAKKSSDEEISARVDKKIRRFHIYEQIFYILTVIIIILLTYFFLVTY